MPPPGSYSRPPWGPGYQDEWKGEGEKVWTGGATGRKGGSGTPSSFTSFHFSPFFLRSIRECPVSGFPSTWGVVLSHVYCAFHRAERRGGWKGQAGTQGVGRCDALGILTGVEGETGGKRKRRLIPAHRDVHIVQQYYVTSEDF